MPMNEKIILASRPQGLPTAEHFTFEEEPLPALQAGEVVVKTLYLSVDP
jgi:NADPH-dependent curcumin reductase CurA